MPTGLANGVGKKYTLLTSRDSGLGAKSTGGVGVRSVHGDNLGAVVVLVNNIQHQVPAGSGVLAGLVVAVNALHKDGVILVGDSLVGVNQGKGESVGRAAVSRHTRRFGGEHGALLVKSVVVNLGGLDRFLLRQQRKLQQRGIVFMELKEFLIDVNFHKIASINTAGCTCDLADSRGMARHLRLQSCATRVRGDIGIASVLYTNFCHCFVF